VEIDKSRPKFIKVWPFIKLRTTESQSMKTSQLTKSLKLSFIASIIIISSDLAIKVGQMLKKLTCQLGEEEFLVITINTEDATLLLLAKRIRAFIQSHQPKDIDLTNLMMIIIGVLAQWEANPDGRVSEVGSCGSFSGQGYRSQRSG